MASAEQIASILRALNPTAISIADGVAHFTIRNRLMTLEELEFDAYLRIRGSSHRITDTSLFYDGFFEQVVEFQGLGPIRSRLFRDRADLVLKHQQSGFTSTLGSISPQFIMFLTDVDTMDQDFRRVMLLRRAMDFANPEIKFTNMFSRIYSIKVLAPQNHSLRNNPNQLESIALASLYHISYGSGIGISSVTSWERSARFINDRNDEIQFPLRTYKPEIVAYYEMALGSESLVLSYLALYKILEYFFTSASEHLLHQKIKEQLTAPNFSHTKEAKLRELAKAIRKFDQNMDERRMLQTVFNQYIDKETLRNWINDFDSTNTNYFCSERDIFGNSLKIDTTDDQLFPNVGTRIYHIRNVLVHNKEGEISRFIPFSGQEKILVNEVPLLMYLSEELISKTGKDIAL